LPGYRLERVLDYIGESLATDVSLSALAAVIGKSPHYFAELFKQSTGRAPHKYTLRQRIERVKQDLDQPSRSIIEVGLGAGFQNPSHFARVFREIRGRQPLTVPVGSSAKSTILCMKSDRRGAGCRVQNQGASPPASTLGYLLVSRRLTPFAKSTARLDCRVSDPVGASGRFRLSAHAYRFHIRSRTSARGHGP
jgi:AraC-like DNA-binding protein